MRKQMLSVLMIPVLLLIGCGGRTSVPEDAFASFREELSAAEALTAEVRMTADHGGTVSEYVLSVSAEGERISVTVTEPALIAGVTAHAEAGEASLAYDGVILGAGSVDREGTTPLSAVPVILRAMEEGYVELCWRDGDYAAARIYAGESSFCTVWLRPDTLTPAAAEIASEGKTVIACRFTAWQTE